MKNSFLTLIALVGLYSTGFGQLKVGNNPGTLNAGAMLEVETTNKGVLMPRVALTATNVWGLAGTATAGMTVYNTATAGSSTTAVTPGYYFNNGTNWVRIAGEGAASTEPWFNETTNAGATSNTQNIYHMGNVGIGTATPGTLLTVDGQGATWPSIIVQGNNTTSGAQLLVDGGVNQYGIGSTGSGHLTPGALIFANNTKVKTNFAIASTGNVGVNTTTPSTLFEVNGQVTDWPQITVAGSTSTTGAGILLNGNGNIWGVSAYGAANPTSASGFAITNNTGGITPLLITANGDVGISAPIPKSKLHVNGLPSFGSDAAAGAAGLTSGAFYTTNGAGTGIFANVGVLMVKQ